MALNQFKLNPTDTINNYCFSDCVKKKTNNNKNFNTGMHPDVYEPI